MVGWRTIQTVAAWLLGAVALWVVAAALYGVGKAVVVDMRRAGWPRMLLVVLLGAWFTCAATLVLSLVVMGLSALFDGEAVWGWAHAVFRVTLWPSLLGIPLYFWVQFNGVLADVYDAG